MYLQNFSSRIVNIIAGFLTDVLLGDPIYGHPISGFGICVNKLEQFIYSDKRTSGGFYVILILSTLIMFSTILNSCSWMNLLIVYISLGGTSLSETSVYMGKLLKANDIIGSRKLINSLCGRQSSLLNFSDLIRSTIESLAENTSDAEVAPLVWLALAGNSGVLLYRGINTLDAMFGNYSNFYINFGWFAAKLDDIANFMPSHFTGLLTVLCSPITNGSPIKALLSWSRDFIYHPSLNAGIVEASFAGALKVRLGGPIQYSYRLEIRPTLGCKYHPLIPDLFRAINLSRTVQIFSVILLVLIIMVVDTYCRNEKKFYFEG